MRFSLSHVDEGFVSHDLFALVQLTFELRGHLLFLSSLEGLKALLHLNLKFKRSFFFEQIEVGFVRETLVAQLGINFGHDGFAGCCFTGLEFKVEPLGPILLVYAVLSFELFTQLSLSLVAVA